MIVVGEGKKGDARGWGKKGGENKLEGRKETHSIILSK